MRVGWLWEAPQRGILLVTACWGSGELPRVSFWTISYRVTRQWALVIQMFHPSHSLGLHFLWKCENRDASPIQGRNIISKAVHKENRSLLDCSSSWEQSVSKKLKKSWAQLLWPARISQLQCGQGKAGDAAPHLSLGLFTEGFRTWCCLFLCIHTVLALLGLLNFPRDCVMQSTFRMSH